MEDQARRHLESKGLQLVETNYSCKQGEIDLVMTDGHYLVFVEVRFRHHNDFCNPLETITRNKQRKIIRTASHYLLAKHQHQNIACRFDAVGITYNDQGRLDINWIPSAFY